MEHQEYPKWKYRDMVGVLVHSDAHERALGDGYADAPSEELESPANPTMRAELEQHAADLGIVIDRRWGDKRLTAEIAAAGG